MSNTIDETREAFARSLHIWIRQDGVSPEFVVERLKEYEDEIHRLSYTSVVEKYDTTYSGHTVCWRCGETHWMYAACADGVKVR